MSGAIARSGRSKGPPEDLVRNTLDLGSITEGHARRVLLEVDAKAWKDDCFGGEDKRLLADLAALREVAQAQIDRRLHALTGDEAERQGMSDLVGKVFHKAVIAIEDGTTWAIEAI